MTDLLDRVRRLLDREGTVRALFGLNALATLIAVVVFRDFRSADHYTYYNLAMGLLRGRYSFWYFLDPYPPDTFRTPGYPLFVALASLGGLSTFLVIVVQAGLHLGALALAQRLVRRLYSDRPLARSLLLLLALVNAQFLYYLVQVFPETLMVFQDPLYASLEVDEPGASVGRHARIGLLLGFMALVRPVAILVPLARFALVLRAPDRRAWLKAASVGALVAYGAVAPYGVWNLVQHGKFSFTPIETSAPQREMGFWQFRLPGVRTDRYWLESTMGREIIPFVSPDEVPAYKAAYDAQWDRIDAAARPFLTDDDRKREPLMRADPRVFLTYSTPYTLARARAIEAEYQARLRESFGYYLVGRAYTAVRLWVTGVSLSRLEQPGLASKIAAVYPTLLTLVCYPIGLSLAGWTLWRHRFLRAPTAAIWLFGFIFWGVHVPMSIQSRYTVPMHLVALVLVACTLAFLLERRAPAEG